MSAGSIAAVRRLAGEALVAPEYEDTAPLVADLVRLAERLDTDRLDAGPEADAGPDEPVNVVAPDAVGRPARVRLVAPRELRRRSWGTEAGRAASLHALAHIEANAVNLALDAVHRFDGLPAAYYADWVRVAAEELSHFEALSRRLAAYDTAYGDLGCHDGLWDAAVRTAHDVGERMALVPLVFEARGLDVTPPMIERFDRHGDPESAAVLRIVLHDEIGHVATGVRWFAHVCAARGLDRTAEFERVMAAHSLLLAPPFNMDARVAAGFDAADLERWTAEFTGVRPPRVR